MSDVLPPNRYNIQRRGLMLVLSSPSGAGKTTISRRLMGLDPAIMLSVSATTRPRRPGEVQGVDYFFMDTEEFREKVERKEFLEHAKVFGHYYGTPRGPVEEALSQGRDVLFDIDWQGTQQLSEIARQDLVSLFILPPSSVVLEQRLRSRAQDSEEVIRGRMAKAADEMSHYSEYDYIVINDDIDEAVTKVQSILKGERQKRHRQTGLREFVKKLQQGL